MNRFYAILFVIALSSSSYVGGAEQKTENDKSITDATVEKNTKVTTESVSENVTDSTTTIVRDSSLGLTIKGNNELPNILYILPWKSGPKSNVSPIQGRIVEEVYGPLEPNVFKRQVNIFRALQKTTEKKE